MRNRLVKKWKSHSGHFCTIFSPTYFSVEVNFTFCKNLILDHPRWKNPEKIQKIFKKLHRAWLVKTKSSEYFTFPKIQNLKKIFDFGRNGSISVIVSVKHAWPSCQIVSEAFGFCFRQTNWVMSYEAWFGLYLSHVTALANTRYATSVVNSD